MVQTAVTDKLVFGPGELDKTIEIKIIDDDEFEDDETFSVILENVCMPFVYCAVCVPDVIVLYGCQFVCCAHQLLAGGLRNRALSASHCNH